MHWAALKHYPEYLALATVYQACGRTVELFTVKARVSSVLDMSFCLV